MSRQTELMAISESKGQKPYRFYLQNASAGLKELRFAPDGWDSAKFEIKRNERYQGLFRTISFNDLKFRKDARDYIRDVYEGQGINAVINFYVDRLGNDWAYTRYFTGKLDLSTYKIDETGVACQVVDTSFSEKIKNRESIKVNVFDTTTVNGGQLPPWQHATWGLEDTWRIALPTFAITRRARWERNAPYSTTSLDHYLPLYLRYQTGFTECQMQTIGGTDPMFNDATIERNFTLIGHIAGKAEMTATDKVIYLTVYMYVNGLVAKQWDFTGSFVAETLNRCEFSIDLDESETVNLGEDVYFKTVCTRSPAGSEPITTEYYSSTYIYMAELEETLVGCHVKAYPIYESLMRVCQKISDLNDVFLSEFFGRTDTPENTYDADGQLGHITKGRFIREAEKYPYPEVDYSEITLELSLAELFAAVSAIWNLGLGIETDENGIERVRVEELEYFFDSNVVCDISALIREAAIEKEVDAKQHYSHVESGYNSFEYLTANGIEEFNAKATFTTVISALDNKLDIVCKYRGDTNGINLLRSAESQGKDSGADENVFIIDTVRDASAPYWLARTSEGFDTITGEPDIDQYFNLELTPSRNLRRHGYRLRAALAKNLGTYIRWQASEKNANLSTLLTGETEAVTENADILVNDMPKPFYLPEIYRVECELRYSDISAILANPRGLVKLSSTKYGWILSMQIGQKENKATFELLRANLDVITPVEL